MLYSSLENPRQKNTAPRVPAAVLQIVSTRKPQQKPESRVLPFDTRSVYHGSLLKARWDVAQKQHFLVVEFFCLFIIDDRASSNRRAH